MEIKGYNSMSIKRSALHRTLCCDISTTLSLLYSILSDDVSNGLYLVVQLISCQPSFDKTTLSSHIANHFVLDFI